MRRWGDEDEPGHVQPGFLTVVLLASSPVLVVVLVLLVLAYVKG